MIIDRPNKWLREFGEKNNIIVLDPLEEFKKTDSSALYFEIDGHWTPKGHDFAAEYLAREMNKKLYK